MLDTTRDSIDAATEITGGSHEAGKIREGVYAFVERSVLHPLMHELLAEVERGYNEKPT